jgi:hypothetical protein
MKKSLIICYVQLTLNLHASPKEFIDYNIKIHLYALIQSIPLLISPYQAMRMSS